MALKGQRPSRPAAAESRQFTDDETQGWVDRGDTAPPVRRRGAELTVPLATRISLEVQDALNEIVDTEGITKRAVVERAIRLLRAQTGANTA